MDWIKPAGLALALSGAALGGDAPGASGAGPDPEEGERLNVLLIIADDLNTRLGVYADPLARSPHIDALAARGVRFDRAYCQFPLCNPSRTSFLTGLRPDRTRVHDQETHFRTALPEAVTLPQLFRRHDYQVRRIGKVFHQGVPGEIGYSGLDDPVSWNATMNPRGREVDTVEEGAVDFTPQVTAGRALRYLADEGADEEQTDGWIATMAVRQLEEMQTAGRSFFLAVGFFRPHLPFVAPKRHFDAHPLAAFPIPPDPAESLRGVPPTAYIRPLFWGLEPGAQRELIRAYYAAVTFMDAQVGRVLEALERLGLADRTIVVFMSDHGFLLGEHGQWAKRLLYEGSARVPLIVAGPGVRRGGVALRPVELLDLYPTLAELARLPPPPGLDGRSLVPLLRDPAAAWPYPAFSQNIHGIGVFTERWAYREWGPGGADGSELYDRHADMRELQNLADDPARAETLTGLRELLHATLPPRTGPPPAAPTPWKAPGLYR